MYAYKSYIKNVQIKKTAKKPGLNVFLKKTLKCLEHTFLFELNLLTCKINYFFLLKKIFMRTG